MYSINFPEMVGNSSAKIIRDHEATASNLKLLLMADKWSLFWNKYKTINVWTK